jgi:hypothetical protein
VKDAGVDLSRVMIGKRDLADDAVHDAGTLVSDAGQNLGRVMIGKK